MIPLKSFSQATGELTTDSLVKMGFENVRWTDTPEECWDFIYEDLTFAAKYLPKRWMMLPKILGEKLLILDVSLKVQLGECWLVPCFMRNVGKMHPMLLWK